MYSISIYTDIPQSPEDQATLEAEYKKNPKPDKMARMSIVEQVSLGEKEVQVSWAAIHAAKHDQFIGVQSSLQQPS